VTITMRPRTLPERSRLRFNTTDILTYHNSGKFKPQYNLFNDEPATQELLSRIRFGINKFIAGMENDVHVGAFEPYMEEVRFPSSAPVGLDEYSKRFVPAIYNQILFENKKAFTGHTVPYMDNAAPMAEELTFSWFCVFWAEDCNRIPVSNIEPEYYNDTFAGKATAISKGYQRILAEMNSGFELTFDLYNREVMNQQMRQAKTDAIARTNCQSLTDLLASDKVLKLPTDKEMESYNLSSDPSVAAAVEASAESEDKRLEREAKAKRQLQSMTGMIKVNSEDKEGADQKVKIIGNDVKPIIPTQSNEEEEDAMYLNNHVQPQIKVSSQGPALNTAASQPVMVNTQQQILLTCSYTQQAITDLNGQQIQIPASSIPNNVYLTQAKNNLNQGLFCSQGYPLVLMKDAANNEQLLDLTGTQLGEYQMFLNQAQAGGGGAPIGGGTMSMGTQPAQKTNNMGIEIAGMEVLSESPLKSISVSTDVTSQATQTNEYMPPAGVLEGGSVPAETAQVEKPVDPNIFQIEIAGQVHPAQLKSTVEYLNRNLREVNWSFDEETHEIAIVYLTTGVDVEVIIQKEKFMNRDAMTPYVIDEADGEVAAGRERNAADLQSNAVEASEKDLTATRAKDAITAADIKEAAGYAICQFDPEARTVKFYPFTIETMIPSVDLGKPEDFQEAIEPESDWDEASMQILSLGKLYNALKEKNAHTAAAYVDRIAGNYLRLCVNHTLTVTEDIKMKGMFEIFSDVQGYLTEVGMFSEMLGKFNAASRKFQFGVETMAVMRNGEESSEVTQLSHTETGLMAYFDGEIKTKPGTLISPIADKQLWSLVSSAFTTLQTDEVFKAVHIVDRNMDVHEIVCVDHERGLYVSVLND
jgi:hypothetical protein